MLSQIEHYLQQSTLKTSRQSYGNSFDTVSNIVAKGEIDKFENS